MVQFNLSLDDRPARNDGFTIACGEQPQARMEKFGVAALSDTELMATLLQGGGTRMEAAIAIATRMMARAGSIAGLANWTAGDFEELHGIGKAKGKQLVTLAEIARRMTQPQTEAPLFGRPDLVAAHLRPLQTGLDVEKFWVACLNRKSRLRKLVELTSGTATATLAHPREVFRAAVQHGATGIVCIHNHPSGDPAPSAADCHITRVLREAAKTVEIELLDHVIVGRTEADPLGRGFYSFREAGIL